MIEDWQETRVEDIAERIAMGPFGSDIKVDNFVPQGVPIIRGGNLSSGRFNDDNFVYLTEEKADKLSAANAFQDDIVFTHRGTLGQVGIIPKTKFARYVVSQSQMKLTCKTNLAAPPFIYYFFKSNIGQQALLINTSQTGVPAISRPVTSLKNITILLPSLSEQRRIAHILGTLDDKIENNRKTAKTLEAMAQAIFKSWFVDFDPVRAKMAGESPESICKRLKLTPEILDLFPDRLVDSELGEIPEGWLTTTLGSITSRIKRGLSPAYSDGYGILVLNQKCIREFMVDTSKARRHDPAVRSIEGLLLEVGDVLVNSTGVGTLGRVAQVLHIQESSIIDSHVTLVRPDKKYPWSYLGQLVMTLQPQIEEMGEGSTGQTELSRGKLANLHITLPTTSILEKYHKIILPVKGRISDCERQIQILKNIRDTLLPKLISGKIRVPDSEVIVEEAL
ncbi:restriction endonuclease subunit S [Acidithiobacillus sp.]|jgi:type I restriction enzyme S subunit|uniref:restriction endonuclease subunit S n=1 Tax=Acidithiobacillus sp. TaxID=1872118 RepID=UPI0025C68934|nr:restriction endonuclease subunit S [Acidithiobacillus sp.]MCK9187836.1 restriction endonuclease subunit S [Acidithiobacillus sp.]MCK9358726.1 restriction endonuclease subunit S [Acidithiobacillus sp.]